MMRFLQWVYLVALGMVMADEFLGEEIQLTFESGHHRTPGWSADGLNVVYAREDLTGYSQIYRVASAGGPEIALTTTNKNHYAPSCDHGGGFVVYEKEDDAGNRQLYKTHFTLGGATPLTNTPKSHYAPRFSPDEEWIVYEKDDSFGSRQIWKVRSSGEDGLQEMQLTSSAYGHYAPQWSPSGSKIAYHAMNISSQTQICIVPANGGPETVLTNVSVPHQFPQWSPDGKWLCYEKVANNGFAQIFKIHVEQGEEYQLTWDGYHHRRPQWSRDGLWIVYHKNDSTGYFQIFMVDVEGEYEIRLTGDSFNHRFPQWCPHDMEVVYQKLDATGTNQIYKLDAETWIPTPTPQGTPSAVPTGTGTHTPMITPTPIPTQIQTASPTPTGWTATPTWTPTMIATPTPTPAPVWSKVGWARASGSLPIAGLVLYGNRTNKGMAGLPACVSPSQVHVLAHFETNDPWFTGLALANIETRDTSVTIKAYDEAGTMDALAQIVIPARGKFSRLLSDPTLFGKTVTRGWLEITADGLLVAFDVYGNTRKGGIAALPSCELETILVLPHFQCNAIWWTGLAIVNPHDVNSSFKLTVFDATGMKLGESLGLLPARCKLVSFLDGLIPAVSGHSGWIQIESSLTELAAIVVFGSKVRSPAEFAAVSAVRPSTNAAFSYFRSDSTWWTGISMVNPDESESANVALRARTQTGHPIFTRFLNIPPRGKVVHFVRDLFDLGEHTQGWIEMDSDLPLVALELLHADDSADQAWGLAGISCQPFGSEVQISHYDESALWWSLFAFANSDDSMANATIISAHSNEGSFAGAAWRLLNPNGNLAERVRSLFDLP